MNERARLMCNRPPFADAVLAEATKISPNRRRSSDGVCGDARHQAGVSDHNPSGPHDYAHAVDISQSTPGSPYWDPKYGAFDAHAHALEIGRRMVAGTETRIKYLVSFDGQKDVILNLHVSPEWRQNGTRKDEHRNHLHVSFHADEKTEQSTAPFFGAPPVTPTAPPPTIKVKPMIHANAALVDVKSFVHPKLKITVAVALTADGAIYCSPANGYCGGMNGQAAFAGRKAAALSVRGDPVYPLTAAEVKAGDVYGIVAESGERYKFKPKK